MVVDRNKCLFDYSQAFYENIWCKFYKINVRQRFSKYDFWIITALFVLCNGCFPLFLLDSLIKPFHRIRPPGSRNPLIPPLFNSIQYVHNLTKAQFQKNRIFLQHYSFFVIIDLGFPRDTVQGSFETSKHGHVRSHSLPEMRLAGNCIYCKYNG